MFRITQIDITGAYTQKDIKSWSSAIAYLLKLVLVWSECTDHRDKITFTIEWY